MKRGRKIEKKKSFLTTRSNPTRGRKFKNKCKKILKIKKHHPDFISRRNGPRQAKRAKTGRKIENKNNFLPIRSNPTRVRKFKNKCKKILKINKHRPRFISRRNGSGQAEKWRTRIISFLSVRTRPEVENSKIIAKRF